MTNPDEPLLNVLPVRREVYPADSKNDFDDDEFLDGMLYNSYSSSSGVVISYKDGTGEVLTQETFDDTGLHFIFSKTTTLQLMKDHDPIGIGSVVQIYWSRSFERVVRGSHVVVHVEKMEVFRCCSFLKEDVFITYNSQSMAGMAIGVTEQNMAVAFHPNCSPEIRYETLRAHHEARTEFQLTSKYNHHLNTNRMVRVILASAPFKIEMNGALDRIPFFVIKRCNDLSDHEGAAVVTKVVRNIFMEATFLDNSEEIFFDSKSCHSNIQDKLKVGSIISVHASPTFPSSAFNWYGYDVTMLDSKSLNELKKSGKLFKEFKFLNKELEDAPKQHSTLSSAFQTLKNAVYGDPNRLIKKEPSMLLLVNGKSAQYKRRYHVLDKPTCRMSPFEVELILASYRFKPTEAPVKKPARLPLPRTAAYTLEMINKVRTALEIHGLNNDRVLPVDIQTTSVEKERQKEKKKTDKPMGDPRVVLKNLMDADGFALNQKVKPAFVLPDTAWKPMEKRFIGVHDDFQWVMMGSFCPQPDVENDEVEEKERPLLGGWWYRRAVPRTERVSIVKEMNTRRNIIKDCGGSQESD